MSRTGKRFVYRYCVGTKEWIALAICVHAFIAKWWFAEKARTYYVRLSHMCVCLYRFWKGYRGHLLCGISRVRRRVNLLIKNFVGDDTFLLCKCMEGSRGLKKKSHLGIKDVTLFISFVSFQVACFLLLSPYYIHAFFVHYIFVFFFWKQTDFQNNRCNFFFYKYSIKNKNIWNKTNILLIFKISWKFKT